MTDAIKFPGTEMEVIEKYPLSRRLDHPDFGDVCKTTFALGVITDFERPDVPDPNDPFVVMSRVKVDIGGDEWLPLFFHPKPLFWDDPAPLATTYNEEGGYFDKAWMSFRCGDEVAVMLKEGKPVVVLGFADGVPRVGEDIVKVKAANRTQYYSMTRGDCQENLQGPDGLDLGLLKEVAPAVIVEEDERTDSFNTILNTFVWSRTIGGG